MASKVKKEGQDNSAEALESAGNNTNGSGKPASTQNVNNNNSNQEKPKAFTIKYKRPRGSRACVVCRSRKVRCDAEIHIPCTNCITFGCECTLPEAKKRGNVSAESKAKRTKTNDKETGDQSGIPFNPSVKTESKSSTVNSTLGSQAPLNAESQGNASTLEPVLNISQVSVPPSLTSNYKTRPSMHKKQLANGKGKAALTFLGSSSIAQVAQKVGQNHVQLTEDVFDSSENSLDSAELEILKLRGAFLLPSHELCLDLINSYFEHVHPLMPVLNRTEFMRKFNDPQDNPSLMVLQAVLLCGCRISQNPLLLDSKGSNNLASLTFFRRAKALYEANYESDPTSIIQTLILIGSYGEGPEDVTKNSFYWTRVAVGLAQGFGFQRDISNSPDLSESDKKIWRRIWWCLFEKDRNVSIAYGRPLVIDLNDCDVPMLTVEDFNEDEHEYKSPYPVNETQALYIIHLVKLAEITGIIIKYQYTVKAQLMKTKNKFSIIQHCDMLMGIWFANLPHQLVFSLKDTSTHNFYSCFLNAQYYNRLYLIHRSNLLRMAKSNSTNPNNYKYPSWGISFQAARMISIVSKILLDRNLIKFCPVMFIYIVFTALVMLIYHVDSPNHVIASTASDSLFVSRAVLKELAKYWPIANVLMKLFDKYANDKMKRAKVIETGSKIAELQELHADQKNVSSESNMNNYYCSDSGTEIQNDIIAKNDGSPLTYGNRPSPTHLMSSGVSPSSTLNKGNRSQPNIEQLVQQIKHLKEDIKKPDMLSSSIKTGETSPTSSTQSFPDISLVTENLPANQNFFENFEPTQLFPDVKFSLPPTRAQSPSAAQDVGDNNYEQPNNENDANIFQAPGAPAFDTNFMDSSFINMNLQSAATENNFLDDDLTSLFNIQN